MKGTKIRLSPTELELACNADIILTKNTVMAKTKTLLEEVQLQMTGFVSAHHLDNHPAFAVAPKISRGENYLGLPYLVLDYPRVFRHTDVLAIRTLFWWGRFFSSTLHLSGSYKTTYIEKIQAQQRQLAQKNYFINVHTDAWQHHFEPDNYAGVHTFSETAFTGHLHTHPHIKIAAKWPVADWHFAANELVSCWTFYVKLLGLVS